MNRPILACMLVLAAATAAAQSPPATPIGDGAIWLGEYIPSAYPARLRSGMPFSDSQDPPGPGARATQPLSALRPWGFLRGGQFVGVGAPLRGTAMDAYGKALLRCAADKPDTRAACRLAVAEGKLGFHTQELRDLTWYCGAGRIDTRDATAAFQDSADGVPTEVPVRELSLAATTVDCGKLITSGFSGDPAIPVSTSTHASVQAFQPLEDLMPGNQVAALRHRLWPTVRQALVDQTRAQLADALARAAYEQQCKQPGLSGRDVQFAPIADLSKAPLEDYARSGADVARMWQLARVDDKRRLIFVKLWANVLLPGVTQGDCPATVRANAWIMDDGTEGGRRLRSPATGVSAPNALLHVEDGVYVINRLDGHLDLGMPENDETPAPQLSIEQLTPEGLKRLGYPGYGPDNPQPAHGLPVGYAH
ncbi:hypothetical protein SAMN05216570_3045 [Dyella sp. OK004]|uniref:hypothetical protein n=1 Tax=Dyella sp. OK004 TaxID=1855292 RepID=UPI0008E3248F|nr:hypothetical protein [Dyella sp. OK004]SFS14241.1 hypothetical protein SAMN05216570_3045 [Dyella sp. OK004]